jgi:RimJ/RimL family protein N-acetyltransferase
MAWPGRRPPERIETERLVLRRHAPEDAVPLNAAANSGADMLRPFVPWARDLPHTLEQTRENLARYIQGFDADESYSYSIYDREERDLLGGAGLFPRIGPGGLEIGYWVADGATGRGIATEAAAALVRVGFETCGADRLELHIDPANALSLRIPAKLGFAEVPGEDGEVLVFRRLKGA